MLNVCRGTTITVQIHGPTTLVTLSPKSGNPAWVGGSSPNGADILLMVPVMEAVGAERHYEIEVTGVGKLDPIFRIIR